MLVLWPKPFFCINLYIISFVLLWFFLHWLNIQFDFHIHIMYADASELKCLVRRTVGFCCWRATLRTCLCVSTGAAQTGSAVARLWCWLSVTGALLARGTSECWHGIGKGHHRSTVSIITVTRWRKRCSKQQANTHSFSFVLLTFL